MASRKWHVWSIDRENMRGLVVVEDVPEKAARSAADSRNASAQRLSMAGTVFIALPDGQQPSEADLPPLPEETAALSHGKPAKTYKDDPIYQAALHPRNRLLAADLQECPWHPSKDHPGHQALVLQTAASSATLVCLEQPDLAMVRAAVTRPDEKGQLAALRNEWTARLGPGGARAVDAAHVAGYALGVDDMTPDRDLVDGEGVLDWLLGFYESGSGIGGEWTGEDQAAISRVRHLITERLEGR